MPSKRFWARQNPELDHEETVTKTKNILLDFKFEKIILYLRKIHKFII